MLIQIDPTCTTPIQRQIIEQIQAQCATGKLKEGDRLPGSRSLAAQLGVSPNTTLHAYERLASQGILDLRQREGAFVAKVSLESSLDTHREELTQEVKRLIRRSLSLGLSPEDFLDIFDNALASALPEPSGTTEAQPETEGSTAHV